MTGTRGGGSGSSSWRGLALLASIVALLIACAQIEPPSGGPVDKDVPFVVETYPDSSALLVPSPADSIAITFSEPMNKRSVEGSVFLTPPVEYERREWDENTWILRLREPLRPGETYVILIGTKTFDRRKNPFGTPYSFGFTTGETLQAGRIDGRVIGRRYPAAASLVYLLPWEQGIPDTTEEGYPPDALRISQAEKDGAFKFDYVPENRAMRLCVFFDRDSDRTFHPIVDRWSCYPDPIGLSDSTGVLTGIDLFIADPDEAGSVSGQVIDSLCIQLDFRGELMEIRARRDSLSEWMEGEERASGRGQATLSRTDSLRIEQEFTQFDSLEVVALQDSLFCSRPILVQLFGDSTLVREQRGKIEFRWDDVPPGIYQLRAFRDLEQNGVEDEIDPAGKFPYPLEVRPLRTLDEIEIELSPPAIDPGDSWMGGVDPDSTEVGTGIGAESGVVDE